MTTNSTTTTRNSTPNTIYDLSQLTNVGNLYLQITEENKAPISVKFSIEGTDSNLALWCRTTSVLISNLFEYGATVDRIIALLASTCYTRDELLDSPIAGVIRILSRYAKLKQEAQEVEARNTRKLLRRPFEFFRDDYDSDE